MHLCASYTCVVSDSHLCVTLSEVWVWVGCMHVKLYRPSLAIYSFSVSFQEVSLDVDPAYMDQFSGLNHVLEALRNKDVEPALE